MSDDNKLLVVAWDGLDYKLIKKFGLEHIPQDNIGEIDNNTGIDTRSTSELYTSFITGATHTKHGVTGINKFNDRGKVLEKVFPAKIRSILPGIKLIYNKLWDLTGADKRKYNKEDYKQNTLFDEIDESKALFVPGYNPGFGWSANLKSHTLDELMYKENPMQEAEKTVKMLFDHRWDSLKDVFDFGDYKLLMVHFHYPDYIQHFYGTKGLNYDEGVLKGMYNDIDHRAKKVKKWAELYGYDVLFISDHGLPKNLEHNKQAFYSTSENLDLDLTMLEQESNTLGLEGIPITMFYDEILNYVKK